MSHSGHKALVDGMQWSSLCDALAGRLAGAGQLHAASLCYIIAGNVEQAVSHWGKAAKGAATSVSTLQVLLQGNSEPTCAVLF
jgi:hypothetical protein